MEAAIEDGEEGRKAKVGAEVSEDLGEASPISVIDGDEEVDGASDARRDKR